MTPEEYAACDGVALAALVRRREVTPLELVELALGRIERLNPVLNAVVMLDAEAARRAAATLDPTAPFAGVPFLAKDTNQDVAPFPTTHGSRFLRSSPPRTDGELARRWRRAGLLILGKTNTPEFASDFVTEPLAYGPTRNPWHLDHTPGGSSGGAAAAVAAGMVPIAHGTDAGGSIRVPAAACHLVGLKPSRGRVPVGPAHGEIWFGLNHEHVLTRSVRDCALMLDATAGTDPGAPYGVPTPAQPFSTAPARDPAPLRVALTTVSIGGVRAEPALVEAVEATARLLEQLGHHVEPWRWPQDRGSGEVAGMLAAVGIAEEIDALARELGREPGPDDLEPATRAIRALGLGMSALELARDLRARNRIARELAAALDGFDLLLTASTATLPPRIGAIADHGPGFDLAAWTARSYGYAAFTEIFNLTGQPAISLPAGIAPSGLPTAVQLAAAFGREDLLLSVAAQLERARPWMDRRPPGT
jgi:amidase